MHERLLPASPNWYCSRCSDTNDKGILGFGAKNTIYLVNVTASSCRAVGELLGHKDRVSGFSFSHHAGQSHLCASCSDDGTVKFWDTQEQRLIKEHKSHQSTITALHWSPVDKNLVLSGDEKGVVVCYWFNTGDAVSFFPEPRNIFCLTCSPHNWRLAAVGYKDGMIVLIDVSKKGEVVQRLRGHDDEIHSLAWAPLANEEALHSYGRPDDHPEATNGVSDGAERGCYLASGSKDQTLRIWSTAKGKGVMTLKLPFLKRRGAGVDPAVRERLWLSVHWPPGRDTQVVSSCFGGELVLWDLTKTGKQKWSLLGASSEGQNHSRIVFNMSSFCLPDGRELLLTTSMDREVRCWDLGTLDCLWSLPTLGGFVYCLAFSPVATGCLALGTGDNMIRTWSTMTLANPYDTRTFWQGIKSKVTALAWHPTKEGSLAFGTDDGKVGIYDVFSNKPPQTSSSYHRKTVYTLAWGPPVPPISFGAAVDRPSVSLYSCAGEGVILQHDPWKLSGEASDIDRLIKDTNGIKHKLSPHTDLSWKPDGSVVAIGNEDGSIEVFLAPSLRLLCSIQQHHKIINALRWHHGNSSTPQHHSLLASASSNALVFVHDLRSVLESPPDIPVVMTEASRSLAGHTAKVTSLAWSPHHDARLVTVCYDGTAQVWDVLQEQGVCNYRGHRGRLLCVHWSTVDPDVVWTGGDDFTAQEWNTTKQQHSMPPKSKKTVDMKEKRKSKTKVKKKKGPSDEEEEEESAQRNGSATPVPIATIVAESIAAPMERNQNRDKPSVKKDVKRDKPDLLSVKRRKPRSLLPLSTSMDHRPREDQQRDCLTLAQVTSQKGPPAGCVPGQGEFMQLGLFSDRQALYHMLQEEEQAHVEAGHYDSMVYLRLWSGDLSGALQLATDRGELSDHLLSLAPMAGYQVWCVTVEAYVKQLCLQEQFLKAASHLLSINKLYEAIHLLHSQQLYREALLLAKARLQPEDPVLINLFTSWAAVLEKDGHLATAAKCYLAVGACFDAAKVIAKKSDPSSLSMAAELARIAGEPQLAHSLLLRCAKDLAANQDWLAAQEALQSLDSLLPYRLHYSVTELLTVILTESKVVTWSCVSGHPWVTPLWSETSPNLQATIQTMWERHFEVSDKTPGFFIYCDAFSIYCDAFSIYCDAFSIYCDAFSIYCDAFSIYCDAFSIYCDAFFIYCDAFSIYCDAFSIYCDAFSIYCDAFSIYCDAFSIYCDAFSIYCDAFSIYSDAFSICWVDSIDVLRVKEKGLAAAESLRAFVSYHRLYRAWWSYRSQTSSTTQRTSPAHPQAAPSQQNKEVVAQPNGEAVVGGQDGAGRRPLESVSRQECVCLLSEPHAAYQTTQTAITEIQNRLSRLVQQHASAQETDTLAGPEQGHDSAGPPPRGGEGETLPSLISKVTEYRQQLAELPDQLKSYPHPDVMECCLVLLHLGQRSSAVPEDLQETAKELLRKYGTTCGLRKATLPFLS
ncbi:gem-associated protein 5 [Aplochiton taeniatus]